MHFSIPDSVEVRGSDSTYLMYNVYINGNFHCSLRYRQFLGLHEQLKREFGFGTIKLPTFPPKKFLSLTSSQLEDRRSSLEKYIQNASQIPEVAKSDLFTGFLRLAQHETSSEPVAKKPIDVFLPNGQQMTVDLWNNVPTSSLLRTVAEDELKLPEQFVEYFGLYVERKETDGTWIVLRKLDEYESPSISLKWLNEDHRIVLRKCAWDLTVDNVLIEDKVGLYLLYVQTVADIERGWITVPRDVLKQLTSFQSKGNKKDYILTARRLKFYGYMKFPYCHIENSTMNEVTMYIGNKELVVVTPRREEISYKVTKMKCWRITLNHEIGGTMKVEMSFEYLVANNKLEWVTISSEQVVIMALCLKEIVASMLAKQSTENGSLIGVRSVRSIYYFIRRDGETVPINEDIILEKSNGKPWYASGSSGNSSPTLSSNGHSSSTPVTPTTSLSRNGSSDFAYNISVSYTKRRPSSNSLRNQNSIASNSNDNLYLENSAFAGIGDDDL